MRFPNLSLFPFSRKQEEDDDSEFAYASFSSRTFAVTLDILLLFLLMSPIFNWFSQIVFPNYYLAGGDAKTQSLLMQLGYGQISLDMMKAEMQEMGVYSKLALDYALQFIVSGVIIVFLWVKFNTTLGLYIFRMTIADADTGLPPSLKQYVIRYIFGVFSIVPFMIGMLWMFFNKRRMSLHDVAANTVILRRKIRFGRKQQESQEAAENEEAVADRLDEETKDKL